MKSTLFETRTGQILMYCDNMHDTAEFLTDYVFTVSE